MPRDVAATVIRNIDLGHGNLLLDLDAAPLAEATVPGQFFMIGVPGADVLLRRPFSVCGLPGTFPESGPRSVQILYKIVGRGTALLGALKPGTVLQVLGPLGKGFEPREDGALPVHVAGGIGIAPFPALAAASRRPPALFYGARHRGDLPLLPWFRERCARVVVTTEDGSEGVRGLVTGPLREFLAAGPGPVRVSACGPTPMLKAVAELAAEFEVPCDLSLEAPMACGFGVCLGCVVPVRAEDGGVRYERCCVEGPVMPASRLAW